MTDAGRRAASGLVTSVGELLVDFVPIEERGRAVGFRMHPGGSLLNVALAAARLGAPSALAGNVGLDMFGRYLREHVEAAGVDVRWLHDVDAPTTLAFVDTTQGDPRYAFYGAGAADTLLVPGDLPEELLAGSAILHVGSISLLRGSTPEAVVSACARLSGRALLSLDPNVRPSLVTDEPSYRGLLDELYGLVDIVKVSVADLAWLAPEVAPEDAAALILARGPRLVVITRGEDGVLALRDTPSGPSMIEVPPFTVTVVDTIGAGDTFTAGMLVRLLELGATDRVSLGALADSTLLGVLEFAAAAAAINCTRAGADPPDRPAVEAFLSHRHEMKEN